jgi:hypothetical protein
LRRYIVGDVERGRAGQILFEYATSWDAIPLKKRWLKIRVDDVASNICQTLERGRDRARDALSRAESQAAAERLAESQAAADRLADNLVCCVCHERRKDTALNCGHLVRRCS